MKDTPSKLAATAGTDAAHWQRHVHLLSTLFAVLAALGALFAGMTSNDLVIKQTREIVALSQLESNRVIAEVSASRQAILDAMNSPELSPEGKKKTQVSLENVSPLDVSARYNTLVKVGLRKHELFAIGSTIVSLAISLSGLAVFLCRRFIFYASIALGTGGSGFLFAGVLALYGAG